MISGYYYFGYLDPSVLTYSIQVVLGILVAIGAFIGVYWRRVKNIIEKRFKIILKSKVEYESDNIYKK